MKKPFLLKEEVSSLLNVDKLGFFGNAISSALLKITKLEELNSAYMDRAHLPAIEFIDSFFEYLGIEYNIPPVDLDRIPEKGPFILIANHPLGAIDGMILIKELLQKRKDFRIMANFILERIEPLKPYILSVNPFEDRKEVKSSLKGIKDSLRFLKDGGCIAMFPAGEVSSIQPCGELTDKEWELGAIKIIKKANVPVVPLFFEAKNSNSFYSIGKINPVLRTALLPRQITSQRNRKIRIKIGNPIPSKISSEYDTIEKLSKYLRDRTYFLENGLQKATQDLVTSYPKVIDAQPRHLLHAEINKAGVLMSHKNYDVILTTKKESPYLIQEIGRLREITFRAIGEGSGNEIDLDQYDEYYKHLVLVRRDDAEVIGAYRIGFSKEIYAEKGLEGFYLSTLFDFEQGFHPVLKDCVELGRAFISTEHQRSPIGLYLLWKGIVYVCLRDKIANIIGCVSLSNDFSDISKSITVEFLRKFYMDKNYAGMAKPHMAYTEKIPEKYQYFIDDTDGDVRKIDTFIDEMNLNIKNAKMPVLFKKYIKQNARIIEFNVDPQFSNVVDGLMLGVVANLPDDITKDVIAELNKNKS